MRNRLLKAAAAIALAVGGLGALQVAQAPDASAASCSMWSSGGIVRMTCPTALAGTTFRFWGVCEASPTQGWQVTSGWVTQGRTAAVVCGHTFTLRSIQVG